MARLFISYKRHDKDRVFPIVDKIKRETGVDCWIDLEGIESGDQFQNVIIDAIDNADIVVFMLSKNFIAPYKDEKTGKIDLKKQTFPEKEVMYALNEGKRLIPMSIDGTTVNDCKWLKFNCSGLDCILWSNSDQRNKFFQNIKQWCGQGKNDSVDVGSNETGTSTLVTERHHCSTPRKQKLPYFKKYVNTGIWIQTIVFSFFAIVAFYMLFLGRVSWSPTLRFYDIMLIVDLFAIIVCTVLIKKYSICKWMFLLLDLIALYCLLTIAHSVFSYLSEGYITKYESFVYKQVCGLGSSLKYNTVLTYLIFGIMYLFHNTMIFIFMNSRVIWNKLPPNVRNFIKKRKIDF